MHKLTKAKPHPIPIEGDTVRGPVNIFNLYAMTRPAVSDTTRYFLFSITGPLVIYGALSLSIIGHQQMRAHGRPTRPGVCDLYGPLASVVMDTTASRRRNC